MNHRKPMARAVLLHYAELALKGRSRPLFERALERRLDRELERLGAGPVRGEAGRLTADLAAADAGAVIEALGRVPGLAWFAVVHRVAKDMEAFKRAAVELTAGDTGTFRVTVKRADRRFPVTSMEIARQMGAAVVAATGRPVALTGFDHEYRLEIAERGAYFYTARHCGLGGLPPGVNGDALVLLSGGVDSAVAAARMMCRGATVHGLHFFNAAARPDRTADRPDRLAAALSRLQGDLTLEKIDFEPVQDAVGGAVGPELRAVVHRRLMLRIGERLRRARGWSVLVTGDMVGQDALQTVENLAATFSALAAPVLTPVAGENREDVIRMAERLGVRAIASLAYEDVVGYRAARHPGRYTTPEDVQAAEARLDVDGLAGGALDRIERVRFTFGERVAAGGHDPGR